jgi:chemotaxis protein methyltransferase CheR
LKSDQLCSNPRRSYFQQEFKIAIMDDHQFQILLEYLQYSWSGYRRVRRGVKKRIQRHMQQLGCRNMTDYLKVLDLEPSTRHECEFLMTVSISRFLRDRRLWEMLERRWLPGMIANVPAALKVWSAGCACGEEVYSFKIIWEQLGRQFNNMPALDLLATDRHPQYLERARSGIYNRSSLREVAPDWRQLYFKSRQGSRQYVIKDHLKSRIRWEIHHLSTEPPGEDFNIICLRNNVLTYYRQEARKKALAGILNHLSPDGLLIIGCHETLPFQRQSLRPMAELSYVFKKVCR